MYGKTEGAPGAMLSLHTLNDASYRLYNKEMQQNIRQRSMGMLYEEDNIVSLSLRISAWL